MKTRVCTLVAVAVFILPGIGCRCTRPAPNKAGNIATLMGGGGLSLSALALPDRKISARPKPSRKKQPVEVSHRQQVPRSEKKETTKPPLRTEDAPILPAPEPVPSAVDRSSPPRPFRNDAPTQANPAPEPPDSKPPPVGYGKRGGRDGKDAAGEKEDPVPPKANP